MERAITIAIYCHAFFGGIGLITGIGSMSVTKGGKLHKRMGRIFTYTMLISCLIIIPVSFMPNHKSLFLFLISIFTIFMVLFGNRATTFKSKKKVKAVLTDTVLNHAMALFSLFMIGYGITGFLTTTGNFTLFIFFGGLGLFLVFRNIQLYRKFKELKVAWILNHISHMMGAMIASVTAFIVAGLKFYTITAWVLPSVMGTVYIIYWRLRVKGKFKKAG
jgi:hypothetical protein